MTYIDYLNRFNLWFESNALDATSMTMYYRLLHIFNRAGWPETVQVDNLRMESMLGGVAKATVIRARDKLVEAGFIQFYRGKKGCPQPIQACGKRVFLRYPKRYQNHYPKCYRMRYPKRYPYKE